MKTFSWTMKIIFKSQLFKKTNQKNPIINSYQQAAYRTKGKTPASFLLQSKKFKTTKGNKMYR